MTRIRNCRDLRVPQAVARLLPSQIAIDAFADAVERAEPRTLAVRALAIAGRWAAAARVSDQAWEDLSDPAPTVACAGLATFAGLSAGAELVKTARARLDAAAKEGQIDENAFNEATRQLVATAGSNGGPERSVYVFLRFALDLPATADQAGNAADLTREARAALPTHELPMLVDLFFSGRPELALMDGRTGAAPSEVGLAAWWLASVQCGAVERERDRWPRADYATPSLVDALVAEADGLLGHTDPLEIDGLERQWLDAINQRRAAGGTRVTGAWRQVALAQSDLAPSPEAEAAYAQARAHLQADDPAEAARALARASDQAGDDRSRAALLTAAAHASAMTDAGIGYSVSYADAAAFADPSYIPAASASLELAVRAGRSKGGRETRLREALARSAGDETIEIMRGAADAVALAARSNEAGQRFLEDAVEAVPSSVIRWMALSEFRQRVGAYSDAISALEEAARREPARRFRATAYEKIAEIFLYDLDEIVPAFESFLVSFVCWQGSASVLSHLEELYVSLGRQSEVPDTYRLAIDLTRGDPEESEHDLQHLESALAEALR